MKRRKKIKPNLDIEFGRVVLFTSSRITRSSPPEVFCEKGVLRNFSKFTGKHLRQRLWYRCFSVNFEKFLRTPFLTEHLRWLLLNHLCYSILRKAGKKLSHVTEYIYNYPISHKSTHNIRTKTVSSPFFSCPGVSRNLRLTSIHLVHQDFYHFF